MNARIADWLGISGANVSANVSATLSVFDPTTELTTYARSHLAAVDIVSSDSVILWCLSETQTTKPASSTTPCQGGAGTQNGWFTVAPTAFTLSSGDGLKTIYLWISDNSGDINTTVISASIIVETVLPSSPTVVLSDPNTNSTTITNLSTVNISISSTSGTKWCVFEQASAAAAPSAPLFNNTCWVSVEPTTQSLGALGQREVYVYVMDAADNISSVAATATIQRAVINAIFSGFQTTCGIASGAAYCWGHNDFGQLGNNTTTDSYVPSQVSGLTSGVTFIGVGNLQACAVVSGAAWCWGNNGFGGLGNGSTNQSLVPVQVSGLTSGVTAVSSGYFHSCGIVNGSAMCWGYNSNGQLGNNSTTSSTVPVQVSGLTSGVTAIASENGSAFNSSFNCAVMNGSAWCWGYNAYGQLGNNSTTQSLVPVQVSGLTSGVESVAAGSDFACAIVSGGVWCWGINDSGQLGNNSNTQSLVPVQVFGLTSGATAISAGGEIACATVNGSDQCWGANTHSALGNGSNVFYSTVPVQVTGLTSNVTSVSSGQYHNCAMISGSPECWGSEGYGEIGDGMATNTYSIPNPVESWP